MTLALAALTASEATAELKVPDAGQSDPIADRLAAIAAVTEGENRHRRAGHR